MSFLDFNQKNKEMYKEEKIPPILNYQDPDGLPLTKVVNSLLVKTPRPSYNGHFLPPRFQWYGCPRQ